MKLTSVRYLTLQGFKNIWAHRMMSIASVGVLVACMLMLGIAVVLSQNIELMLGSLEQQNVVLVYYQEDYSEEQAVEATHQIADLENVRTADFVSKEEGLERQKQTMGEEYSALFDWVVDENPLPHAARVVLRDLTLFDETLEQIRSVEGVDQLSEQREVAQKITAIRSIVNNAGFWIIVLLTAISLVIVSNTIRVTMYARKREINIMKAVGATNSFIRLPFVIEGVVLGILAGCISIGALYFIYKAAIKAFVATFNMQAVGFSTFVWPLLGAFVLLGVAVGVIGSVLSIGKYLRREGSEFNAIS